MNKVSSVAALLAPFLAFVMASATVTAIAPNAKEAVPNIPVRLSKTLVTSEADRTNHIQQLLNKILPTQQSQIEEIALSPMPGMMQVTANNEIFYTSADGKYLIKGELITLTDANNVLNYTEAARKKITLRALHNITKKEFIVFKAAPHKRKTFITIFTDVDCGYCNLLHKDLAQITDKGIDVRYLPFPRQGPGSSTYKKTVSIWCADDPIAMMNLAQAGKSVQEKICQSCVDKQHTLGNSLHIQGTPTIILADGTILPGYVKPDDLTKLAIEHSDANGK